MGYLLLPITPTIKNFGMNFVKVFLTGLIENEIFFHNRKLTPSGIVFRLNKTFFTHFDCE